MAGVVTYDLESPTATCHFLLIGSDNRQQVTVFSGLFLVRKEKNKYGGSYDLEPPTATCHFLLIGSGNRRGSCHLWHSPHWMIPNTTTQLEGTGLLVVTIDNRSLYSVVLFWFNSRHICISSFLAKKDHWIQWPVVYCHYQWGRCDELQRGAQGHKWHLPPYLFFPFLAEKEPLNTVTCCLSPLPTTLCLQFLL